MEENISTRTFGYFSVQHYHVPFMYEGVLVAVIAVYAMVVGVVIYMYMYSV